MGMAWTQYGHGVDTVWAWRGHSMGMAWTQYGHGVESVWAWRGHSMGMAWTQHLSRQTSAMRPLELMTWIPLTVAESNHPPVVAKWQRSRLTYALRPATISGLAPIKPAILSPRLVLSREFAVPMDSESYCAHQVIRY